MSDDPMDSGSNWACLTFLIHAVVFVIAACLYGRWLGWETLGRSLSVGGLAWAFVAWVIEREYLGDTMEERLRNYDRAGNHMIVAVIVAFVGGVLIWIY